VPGGTIPAPIFNCPADKGLDSQTVRNVVFLTAGGDRVFQADVPGTNGRPHTTIEGAGHFLQEDRGEQIARVVVDFITATPGS